MSIKNFLKENRECESSFYTGPKQYWTKLFWFLPVMVYQKLIAHCTYSKRLYVQLLGALSNVSFLPFTLATEGNIFQR